MKKILGVAAAALLLSAGAASAKVTAATIQISLLGQTCAVNVTPVSDASNGVYNKEYVIVDSNNVDHNCSVNGEGLLAKATFVIDKAGTKDTQDLAIISAYSPYLSYVGATHVTFTLTTPFVTGGTYVAYYYGTTSTGKPAIVRITSGTYTVE
jgi:hypothetical protein